MAKQEAEKGELEPKKCLGCKFFKIVYEPIKPKPPWAYGIALCKKNGIVFSVEFRDRSELEKCTCRLEG